jgi:hypothetical protein
MEEPSKTARFNEIHYPWPFLQKLKGSGKKRVPSKLRVEEAKLLGMYREDLVVGKDVVVVPPLTAQEAKEAAEIRAAAANVPATPVTGMSVCVCAWCVCMCACV